MRLDHFVLSNNNRINNQNGASMPKNNFPQNTPSIELNRVFGNGLKVWIKQQQNTASNLIYGRIQDTGVNYIVEGFTNHNRTNGDKVQWVRIPCKNLTSARLLLGSVMDKDVFAWNKNWFNDHEQWSNLFSLFFLTSSFTLL